MESDSSGLTLLNSQEVVQSQRSEVAFFRSPRVESTTLYEEVGATAPTVGDRLVLSLTGASLAPSPTGYQQRYRSTQIGVLPRASPTVPLCPGNGRTLSRAFRCFSPIVNSLLVPRDDCPLF